MADDDDNNDSNDDDWLTDRRTDRMTMYSTTHE